MKRYSPPTDLITLRRGVMFLDPDSRAKEYMGLIDKIQKSMVQYIND